MLGPGIPVLGRPSNPMRGLGLIAGDVAWGGNWFFLTEHGGQELRLPAVEQLTDVAWRIRQAVNANGFPSRRRIPFNQPGARLGNIAPARPSN